MSRWFPGLRQALGLESKALTIAGLSGYSSPRVHTYGQRDAAAGWDLDQVVQDGYERVVWVFKAVEIIAGNASRLPFVIRHGEEPLESHPLMRTLNKQANPMETGRAFRKRLSAQVLLSKRGAFVEVTKSRAGHVVRLDLLPPDRVRIVPDLSGDYVSYFEYTRLDGQVRNLPPEKVRWIREPHPLDPFSGVTPLEAAGMSVELDRLARAYNVSFINRDGRPGGIVGVDVEGLEERELDRIANTFKPGAAEAGTIKAFGVGKGGMTYIDTSARPRDMAYETTSEKAKREILAAFGVPESLAGNAAERTYENASQEELNFWRDPMLPHLDLLAAAFDGDVDDEYECGFDTSGVEALELPNRRKRQEAREEFESGLRTIKEYREVADDLEVIDNPQTRALWVSPAKAPVPGVPGDAAALGLEDPTAAGGDFGDFGGGDAGMPGDPAAPDGGPQTAQEVIAQALAENEQGAPQQTGPTEDGPAAAVIAAARTESTDDPDDPTGPAERVIAAARLEGKALSPGETASESLNFYDPGHEDSKRVELAVAAALEAILTRQASVIAARLESPKTRRGTRWWVAQGEEDTRAGDDPIDTARVVDTARWSAETFESLQPIVTTAARESSTDLYAAMAATGALVGAVPLTAAVAGRAVEHAAATADDVAGFAAQAAAAPAMLALAVATGAVEAWEAERIADIDHLISEAGEPDLPTLIESVRTLWADKVPAFARSVAVSVAQAAVQGGREAAVERLVPQVAAPSVGAGSYLVEVPPHVARTWRTRRDERVRASHAEADGQVRGLGEPFIVGGHELRYPSDPFAPPEVSRWCRCWIRYEWAPGVRFTVERNDQVSAAA